MFSSSRHQVHSSLLSQVSHPPPKVQLYARGRINIAMSWVWYIPGSWVPECACQTALAPSPTPSSCAWGCAPTIGEAHSGLKAQCHFHARSHLLGHETELPTFQLHHLWSRTLTELCPLTCHVLVHIAWLGLSRWLHLLWDPQSSLSWMVGHGTIVDRVDYIVVLF